MRVLLLEMESKDVVGHKRVNKLEVKWVNNVKNLRKVSQSLIK